MNNNILYVILHGSMNPERWENVVNTWGQGKNYLFYSDHHDPKNRIFKVSNRTDYLSNEDKHVNVWKLINTHKLYQIYEWFFFCDDDTFVNTKLLESNLNNFDKNNIHGHVMQCYPQDPFLNYCSGGAGYLINRKRVEYISKGIKFLDTGYSDVTLGMFCRENKIKFDNDDRFNPNDEKGKDRVGVHTQDDRYRDIKNPIEFFTHHYVKNFNQMNDLYKLMNIIN